MFNSPDGRIPPDDLRKILPGCQQVDIVPNGVETLPKISIAWVSAPTLQTDRRTDGRWHKRTWIHVRKTLSERRHPSIDKISKRKTYPGRHWFHRCAFGTKIQMQDNNGNHDGDNTQADDEYEIHHYTNTHAAIYRVIKAALPMSNAFLFCWCVFWHADSNLCLIDCHTAPCRKYTRRFIVGRIHRVHSDVSPILP